MFVAVQECPLRLEVDFGYFLKTRFINNEAIVSFLRTTMNTSALILILGCLWAYTSAANEWTTIIFLNAFLQTGCCHTDTGFLGVIIMSILPCVLRSNLRTHIHVHLQQYGRLQMLQVFIFPMDSYETLCQRITFHKKLLWRAVIRDIIWFINITF